MSKSFPHQFTVGDVRLLSGSILLPLVVFGTAAATMVLEIALTRIYSYALLYHFVPLAVAGALLGIGVGGGVAWWLSGRLGNRISLVLPAGAFLILSSLSVIAMLLLLPWLARGDSGLWRLALTSFLPFCLSGTALALLFTRRPRDAAFLYAGDLVGAAGGTLAAVALMNYFSPVGATYVSALLFLVAGASVILAHLPRGRYPALLGLLVTAVALWSLLPVVHARAAIQARAIPKTLGRLLQDEQARVELVYTRWDAFARTDVVQSPRQPDRKAVYADGMAGSTMYRFDGDLNSIGFLRNTLQYIPFAIRPPESVLTIGPGGGEDILLALLAGGSEISGVEVNPGALDAAAYFADYNGGVFTQPEVHITVDDGRSYLRRSEEQFDLIYLGLVTSYVSELGNLALAESYIYTVEAFQDYVQHLRPGGYVALMLHDERDTLRAFVTALVALSGDNPTSADLAAAARHLALFVQADAFAPGTAGDEPGSLLLIGKEPLLPVADVLVTEASARGIEPLHVPGAVEGGLIAGLATGTVGIEDLVDALDYDVSPTHDRRPFFFMFDRGLADPLRHLALLAVATAVISLLTIVAARFVARPATSWFFYFACIGAAFAAVEVTLSQSLVLFLGHPSHAFTVVLVGLLAAGAIGSSVSAQVEDEFRLRRVSTLAILLLGGLCVLYAALLGPIQHLVVPALLARMVVAVLIVAPLGILMGIPFPTAMRLATRAESAATDGKVGLFWMINGLMSVTGAVGALVIAITFGLPAVLLAAGIVYLLAVPILR